MPTEVFTNYKFSIFDVQGATSTFLYGANSSGSLVGNYEDANGQLHGFYKSDNIVYNINMQGAQSTYAYGINNSNEIVGAYYDGSNTRGFSEKDGLYTEINIPGSTTTIATGINDAGQIVGFYTSGNTNHGFVEAADGTYTTFDPPGSRSTGAFGINSLGQVVGFYNSSSGDHSFLQQGGSYSYPDDPSSNNTDTYGINATGQTVGIYNFNVGYVETGDTYSDIAAPNSANTTPRGITDDGTVVGYYTDAEGTAHGFVASVACYCCGTRILTDNGEVSVEELAIGDMVLTASGVHRPIKWIGKRSYIGRFANANPHVLPICFTAGCLAENTPTRDLWISPKHAMFIDGVLIPAEHLVNGVSVIKADRVDLVEYFHVELESHDAILAEGALSETFVDDYSRSMFHNLDEYRALFPNDQRVDAIYCAPRVEDGYELEAVRRRLAERAGLQVPAMPSAATLKGNLDYCDGIVVKGWAWDEANPEARICVAIVVDGAVVARTFAEQHSGDLENAGIGDGRHAFSLRLPGPFSADAEHVVELRRSIDGALLSGTIRFVACSVAAA